MNTVRVRRPLPRRSDLTDALGIAWHDLLRRCERATDDRNAACCLFWTLGGNQVGKAALAMWNEILPPALEEGLVAVWPFHGRLPALLVAGRAVLAETYPGESYHHVGAVFANAESKRKRPDRVSKAAAILGWADAHGVVLTPAATAAVQDGFGDDDNAEDRFDAFVGLLGMLEVVLGIVPDGVPANDPAITATEGWILGQQ